jgi:Cu+-exporting ATPase
MPNIPFFSHHPDVEIDPVCKMKVSIEDPPGGKDRHEGATYFFCALGCRNNFIENPSKYLDPAFEGESM